MNVDKITTSPTAGVTLYSGTRPYVAEAANGLVVAHKADSLQCMMTLCPSTYDVYAGEVLEIAVEKTAADAEYAAYLTSLIPPPAHEVEENTNPATSLRANIAANVDVAIAVEGVGKVVFSAPLVRDPDCWGAGLDLTCMSPWNSQGEGCRAGVLVSPRHIAFAAHYPLAVGTVVKFVTRDGDNTVIERTITAVSLHPDYIPTYPDLAVALLDSDVPGTITFAKILPQDWSDYLLPYGLYNTGYAYKPMGELPEVVCGLPVVVTDQEENLLVFDALRMQPVPEIDYPQVSLMWDTPVDATRLAFNEGIVPGDSGDPAFLVINNEMVLVTVVGSGRGGTNLAYFRDDVNAMMAAMSVGTGQNYQLTEANLSGFTKV